MLFVYNNHGKCNTQFLNEEVEKSTAKVQAHTLKVHITMYDKLSQTITYILPETRIISG